jgi:hypothetical protein
MQIHIESKFKYSVSLDIWGWLMISALIMIAAILFKVFVRRK